MCIYERLSKTLKRTKKIIQLEISKCVILLRPNGVPIWVKMLASEREWCPRGGDPVQLRLHNKTQTPLGTGWGGGDSTGGGSMDVTLGEAAAAQSLNEGTDWTQYTYLIKFREMQLNLEKLNFLSLLVTVGTNWQEERSRSLLMQEHLQQPLMTFSAFSLLAVTMSITLSLSTSSEVCTLPLYYTLSALPLLWCALDPMECGLEWEMNGSSQTVPKRRQLHDYMKTFAF